MGAGSSHGEDSECMADWGIGLPIDGVLLAVSFYAARRPWWGNENSFSYFCSTQKYCLVACRYLYLLTIWWSTFCENFYTRRSGFSEQAPRMLKVSDSLWDWMTSVYIVTEVLHLSPTLTCSSTMTNISSDQSDFDFWEFVSCAKCQLSFSLDTGVAVPFWLTQCGHVICNNHLSLQLSLHKAH